MKYSEYQVEVLGKLSSEYKEINPFATLLDKDALKKRDSNWDIFLSDDNLGYIVVKNDEAYISITDIYSRSNSKKTYSELLKKLSGKVIKYVGVYKEDALNKALLLNGFNVVKEHHQLIKILDNEVAQAIELKNLSDIKSEDILKILNLYAPEAEYTLDEITRKKYRKHSFYIYDKELIGIIIAFIDPLKKNSLYLEQIVIKKSQQGKGYGKKALKELLFLAQKENFLQVRLHVYKDNKIAYNLYVKQGFSKDKIIAYWESRNGTRRV